MNRSPRFFVGLAGLIAALALTLGACASGGGSAAAPTAAATAPPAASASDREATAKIEAENIAFKPAELTVLVGTKVTWVNRDAGVRHTATSGEGGDKGVPGVREPAESRPDGVFDGNLPNDGDTYSHVFTEAGTYAYFCAVHPSMRGTIVVE